MSQSVSRLLTRPPAQAHSARIPSRRKEDQNDEIEDEFASEFQLFARSLLRTTAFDVVIGIVIAFNAVSIGVEQSLQVAGHDTTVVQIIESIFLGVYIIELATRFVGHGARCLGDNWVKFDCFLVFFGILSTWVVEPLANESPGALGPLLVLRVLRLLRLAKTARLFAQIQEFWKLIRGFLNSVGIMCYTLVIVLLILYVFTSLGVEIITKHKLAIGAHRDEAFADHVDKYFATIPGTMLTLMQFVTLDNMSHVYRPLVEKDPWLACYFILLILVVSILLMNLVAAVIFSSILEQEQDEHEEFQHGQELEWASMIHGMKELFMKNDKDKSGQLSRQEVLAMDVQDHEKLFQALGVNTPIEVFNALDVDRSGEVSINEFFDGIWAEMLANGAVDLKRLEKQIETMHWRSKETFGLQHDIQLSMDKVCQRLDSVLEETADMRSLAGSLINTLAVAQKGVSMKTPSMRNPEEIGNADEPKSPSGRPRSIKRLIKQSMSVSPRTVVAELSAPFKGASGKADAEKPCEAAHEVAIGRVDTKLASRSIELQPTSTNPLRKI